MAIPALPASGSTSWYSWAQGLDSAARNGRAIGSIDAVAEFGLSPSNTAADNASRLTNAFNAAISGGLECYIGPGAFPVSNGLIWNAQTVRIRGAGSKLTRLVFPSNTENGLQVGNGTLNDDLGSDGYVSGLRLSGPGAPSTKNGKAAFLVNRTYFMAVESLYADGFDVGYDMINNNYGISWRDVHSRYQACNLALRIRTADQSGNDVPFYNCWLGGKHHAVSMEPGTIGLADVYFYGGQLGGGDIGGTTDHNDRGVVNIGPDYLTGTTIGEATNLVFQNVSWEGYGRQWGLYLTSPTDMVLDNCLFTLYTYGADNALGVLRHTLPYADNIQFRHVGIDGPMKTAILDLTPDPAADPTYIEIGTRGRPTVNGVTQDLYKRGIFDRMGLSRGIAIAGGTKSTVMLDGLRLRNNAGTLQKSTDGTTWAAVTEPQYVNLLTANQSSAATDVTEVFPASATAARETAVVPQGSTTSVKLTSTNSTSATVALESATPTFGVAGNTVTARALVLAGSATATRQARISLIWRNSSNTVVSTSVASPVVTDSAFAWTAIEVTGVAPATAVKASAYLEWLAVPGTGEVHYATRLTVARTA